MRTKPNVMLLNSQKYSECQLVAVINAASYLGEPLVVPASEEYERLVDLVGARHGSAISIRKAIEYLRLQQHEIEPITLENVQTRVMSGSPVSVGIQHPTAGFHAVLLTDGDSTRVKVWNLRRKEFPQDCLTWLRLGEMMAAVPSHCRRAEWYDLDPLRIRERESRMKTAVKP